MKLCTIFRVPAIICVLYLDITRVAFAAGTPADIIIYNAKVITVNSNFSVDQAIAVRGNQIVAVGRNRQVERLKGADTAMVNANGQTVMPGLCDSDVFSYQAAISDSTAATTPGSIAEALDYIRHEAATKPAEAWINVQGAYPTRLKEGRLPTKAELDAAAPKNPVYWNCGRVAMVNTKALEISKITAGVTNPPGGEVILDEMTRQPTGLLRNASSLIKLPQIRPPSMAQRREALKHLYQRYNEKGLTSIEENYAGPEAVDLFRALSKAGELTVRVNCARFVDRLASPQDTLALLASLTNVPTGKLPYGPSGVGDDWVRIGPLKTRMDGDILDGTAYLRSPWGMGPTFQITEPAYRGELSQNPDLLVDFILQATKADWQLGFDCTGDAALDQLLNCVKKAQFKMDIRGRRLLVNHASFQADQNWPRFREAGLVASVQPSWLYCDGTSLDKTLGDKKLKHFIALKSWFDNQLVVGGGSDHGAGPDSPNVNPWDPWLGMWIALARQTDQGAEIWPEEKLSRQQAIQLYTINNAFLTFDETKKGSLEVGKLADLIMIDTDILKCPVDEVRATKVRLTMVDGKIVWQGK